MIYASIHLCLLTICLTQAAITGDPREADDDRSQLPVGLIAAAIFNPEPNAAPPPRAFDYYDAVHHEDQQHQRQPSFTVPRRNLFTEPEEEVEKPEKRPEKPRKKQKIVQPSDPLPPSPPAQVKPTDGSDTANDDQIAQNFTTILSANVEPTSLLSQPPVNAEGSVKSSAVPMEGTETAAVLAVSPPTEDEPFVVVDRTNSTAPLVMSDEGVKVEGDSDGKEAEMPMPVPEAAPKFEP